MKKVLVLIAVAAFAMMAQADLINRTWTSQTIYATPSYGPAVSGAGANWQIDIALSGSSASALSLVSGASAVDGVWGWYDGYGYTVAGFNFDAVEGQNVVMRIFNATTQGAATSYLDSSTWTLADVEGAPAGGAFDVTFNFTGSNWTAIPEPATVGMLGLGAIVALALRRGKRFNRADLA